MFKILVVVSLLGSSSAFAQMTQIPQTFRPVPSGPPAQKWGVRLDATTVAPLPQHEIVDALAKELDRQFQKVLAAQKPKRCSDRGAFVYAQKLLQTGRFADCAAYARKCSQDPSVTLPEVIEIGGECEAARFRPAAAKSLYDLAISARFSAAPGYAATVLKAAANAYNGSYEKETSAILARAFPEAEFDLWKSAIGEAAVAPHTAEEVRAFLKMKIGATTGRLQSVVKAFRIKKLNDDYQHATALEELSRYIFDLESPVAFYNLAYKIVYEGLDQNFAQARKIYDVYDRYSGPTWLFPTEQNTYNYTEIYRDVCAKQLLSESERGSFDAVRGEIRKGSIGPVESLKRIEKLARKYAAKADVLTTYGGLLALNGRHEEAMRAYWKAHRLCRYYNRANWGLTLENRYLKYRSFPDYNANAAKVTSELAKVHVPDEVSTYFLNWRAFDRETQKRIEYGARIWLPYLADLKKNSFNTYIKFSFDLLSESPELESVRDVRIGGEGYPNDNRLWDDVRGLGGSTVVADAAEVFQTVQGDYNLLGHEMAHQFQGFLETTYKPGFDCIVQLYDEAKKHGRFPDGYSAQNKEEHFAQGITYSMIPADAPKRYGLNRSWLVANDPKQMRFIESIERSNGQLSTINCAN